MSIIPHHDNASPRELEDWKAAVRQALASLTAEDQLGRALLDTYDRTLNQK